MKNLFLISISLLVFALLTTQVYAQKNVSGVVKEATGPMPGVSIFVKGTQKATQTNRQGIFNISAQPTDVLIFSALGYIRQEIVVGNQTTINVILIEESNSLSEVVVTALGIKRERKSLGYAVQELKGETLVAAKEPNLANALIGKIAGLQVIRSSNGPAGSSKIQLRGNNSLTGSNQPLIVVDGTPIDNFTGATNNDFWMPALDFGNGISDINAEDIESVSVLKGPSAAALYGSRAGNGVILITTKSGKAQKGLGISINSTTGIETIFTNPKMQNDFGQGTNVLFDNRSNTSWGAKIYGQPVTNWNGTTTPMQAYDNVDNYFNTGLTSSNSISFQQQFKNTSVYTSISRLEDKSMIPSVKLARTNLMARGISKFGTNERWILDTKIQYNNSNAKNRPIGGQRSENAFWAIYNLPRSLDITQFSAAKDEFNKMIWYGGGNQINPYWSQKYNTNNDIRNRFIMNGSLKYNFTTWLNAELRAGSDFYNTSTESKLYAGSPLVTGGRYSNGKQSFYETNYSAILSARKDNLIKKLGGAFTLGVNLMSQQFSLLNGNVGELNVPNLFSLNNGISNAVIDEAINQKKINSVFGSGQLSWDGYLFVDATFRNDWSSALSKENRSFFYPSVSLSYVFTEMLTNMGKTLPNWLSYAKFRAALAQVGNDMGAYQLYNTYVIEKDPNGNTVARRNNILFDPNVKSELIKSTEVGAEFRFFKNKFGLDFSWYKSNATNQLIDLPMDPLSGYTAKKINAGNLQNTGVELMVDAQFFSNPKSFKWNLSANYSHNNNTVKYISDNVNRYNLGGFDDVRILAVAGEKYGEIYGSRFARVNDQSSPFFGQVIVDGNGLPLRDPEIVKLGNQQATALLGFTNTFAYKGIGLSFLVDARFGGQLFSASNAIMQQNGTAAVTVVNGSRNNLVADGVFFDPTTNKYLKNTKEIAPQQYWTAVAGNGNIGITEANLYDASNIRLRNVNLSYELSQKFLAKTPIQRVNIGFSVNNVWLIQSHLNGIDPESVFATGTNAVGFENASAPTSRTYLFNLTLGF